MEVIKIGQLKAQPLGDSLGIFIQDLDPNQPLSEQAVKNLTQAINEYHLVLLKSEYNVHPRSHVALTKRLGDPWTYGYSEGQYLEYPEIF